MVIPLEETQRKQLLFVYLVEQKIKRKLSWKRLIASVRM